MGMSTSPSAWILGCFLFFQYYLIKPYLTRRPLWLFGFRSFNGSRFFDWNGFRDRKRW